MLLDETRSYDIYGSRIEDSNPSNKQRSRYPKWDYRLSECWEFRGYRGMQCGDSDSQGMLEVQVEDIMTMTVCNTQLTPTPMYCGTRRCLPIW